MRTFASLEIRFEYVLVGKMANRRIIRRKIRSCDSGISLLVNQFPGTMSTYIVNFKINNCLGSCLACCFEHRTHVPDIRYIRHTRY